MYSSGFCPTPPPTPTPQPPPPLCVMESVLGLSLISNFCLSVTAHTIVKGDLSKGLHYVAGRLNVSGTFLSNGGILLPSEKKKPASLALPFSSTTLTQRSHSLPLPLTCTYPPPPPPSLLLSTNLSLTNNA